MDDILKNKQVLSIISTDDFVEDFDARKRLIISTLYSATGLPFNYLDVECGDLIKHCLDRHYNDRVTLGTCFARLWANHCTESGFVEEEDDDDEIRGLR